ncbi:MAG: DUF2911 domain-containing protein [Lutibacter sp.]|nr:DUF2911 domain-containing protein [Lutibacter sp.]
MNHLKILSLAFVFLTFGCKSETNKKNDSNTNHLEHQIQEKSVDTLKVKPLSPKAETMALIGDAHIHIDYSSPRVRGRIIFGSLVSYENLWQSGAHRATRIETNKDLLIAEKIIPAGKYAFFTIPSKGEWTIILNKIWDQHGKDEYDEKEDILRFKVTPKVSEKIQEELQYKIVKNSETSGNILLTWEKVTISFPFEVK